MKTGIKMNDIAELVLAQLDSLGYRLDTIGIDNQINRHNLIALLMFGQKRLEGEMDSLSAKVDTGKAKVEAISGAAEDLLLSGVNLALFPATYTYDRVRSQF